MNNYLSQFSGFSGIGNQGFGVVDPMRARAEQMRVGLANSGINGVPEASLAGAARTQSPPVILDEGKSYFLKQDTALRDRLMAMERESARRGNRPVQGIAPSYNYQTETGERFRGTFIGNGSYGGFGGGKAQSSQRSWDNYVPLAGPRNPNYGSNPEKAAFAAAQAQIPTGSLGMTGEPIAFTGFGAKTGLGPKPTQAITSPAQSPFSNRLGYGSSYGLGPQSLFAR